MVSLVESRCKVMKPIDDGCNGNEDKTLGVKCRPRALFADPRPMLKGKKEIGKEGKKKKRNLKQFQQKSQLSMSC